MKIWLHDRLVPPEDAVVSVLDHGFTVGDGVFETISVRQGQPCALTRHLRRLAASAAGMGLPQPDANRLRTAISAVLAAEPLDVGRVRITWTSGVGPMGSGRDGGEPTLVIVATGVQPWPATTRVALVPWTRNEHGASTGLKTTSYVENVVALAYAQRQGADEALLLNTAGRLCEGASTNVIVEVGGRLVTPPLSSGCLAGITRELALEWCGVNEADITVDQLMCAEEILVTSSTRDLHPVSRLIADGVTRDLTAPGPLSRSAIALFAERLAETPDP